MIQRIQTLWLAFVILITVGTFFFPIVEFSFNFKGMQQVEPYGLLLQEKSADSMQLVQTTHAWSLIFFQSAIALLALVTIFFFKNRALQIRLTAGNLLLLTIYVAFVVFVKIDGIEKQITELYSAVETSYNTISICFPLLQLGLIVLAQRAIRKDDRLVRASDRLR